MPKKNLEENSVNFNNMMLTTSNWGPYKTFKLMPLTEDCPYVEAIFDPSSKILAIISKHSKQSYHFVPKIDDNGDPVKLRINKRENGKDIKEQRVLLPTHAEYYIQYKSEIESIIHMYAINADTYDYKKYFEELVPDEKPLPSEKATSLDLI